MLSALIISVGILTGAALLWPRVAHARLWRAGVTPLASIIGSGFLVIGPILIVSFGEFSPLVMAALCALAYAFGGAIRFNIARIDATGGSRSRAEQTLETGASWVLAFAYVISVAYYLFLFGTFSVSLTAVNDIYHARLVTTAAFLIILLVGWGHGFAALESLEQITVGIKLAVIAGLLCGLVWYFADRVVHDSLVFNPIITTGYASIALFAGLLVTTQGFEISRYLGNEYDAPMRIRSMRLAQLLASAIYLIYMVLVGFVFPAGQIPLSETGVIDLFQIVAPVLPMLLIAAALSSQFSAAVADTGGSGGLVAELTGARVSERSGYVVVAILGLALVWVVSVFEIISLASRAFALYYGLQSAIAARGAMEQQGARLKSAWFATLSAVGFAIAIIGEPVE